MKLAFLSVLCLIVSPCLTRAGCPVAVSHAVSYTPVVTAYAVGIPVAYAAPYQYSTGGQDLAPVVAELRALRLDMARMQVGALGTRAVNPYPMLSVKCANCHNSNAKAQAALSFADIGSWTCEQRLMALDAVVNDRMPKGGHLTADEAGSLLKELPKSAPVVQSRPPAPMPGTVTPEVEVK